MESQTKCNDTISENTPNTSAKVVKARKFKLIDLHRLTFQLEEQEQTFDIETCTPEQFHAFASEMVEGVEDVDVNVWPLEVRRDLINDLWDYCLTESYEFPLTEVQDKVASEAK